MKFLIFIFVFVFSYQITLSQDTDKVVIITVSGNGKTQDEAKQSAFRSAIEQAFGAFISSKTEILNDKLVADQISSVANGNIKSFTILNESQLPDGTWGVTLKVLVSISKLTSFIEAKGIAIEIKGGLFAFNIKQQLLNEQGETKAVSEMVGLLHEPMQISFDYEINSSDPKSLDAESKNWSIPLVVTAYTNKNFEFCANYFIKTIAAISLTSDEIINYKNLNKSVFPVNIKYDGVNTTFYLRKQGSINALNTFTKQWEFYIRLFSVQSGMDESYGKGNGDVHDFDSYNTVYEEQKPMSFQNSYRIWSINFLIKNKKAGTFTWEDKRSLAQIEKMTGYKVKPRGIISQYKHGGFVFFEQPASYRIGIRMKGMSNEVGTLEPGGVAEKAGLQPGDKIISINDIQVVDFNIGELINNSKNKDKLCNLKIERSGKILKVVIVPIWVKGSGLVAAITGFDDMNWLEAKSACDELELNGYNDWYLPSKIELNLIYLNLVKIGAGGFANYYWSSTEDNERDSWMQTFQYGKQDNYSKGNRYSVRAVRAFY